MSTQFIHRWPRNTVVGAAAATGCGTGRAVAVTLQEALGLGRVEQSIDGGKLIG